jgi:hypothetical protein
MRTTGFFSRVMIVVVLADGMCIRQLLEGALVCIRNSSLQEIEAIFIKLLLLAESSNCGIL